MIVEKHIRTRVVKYVLVTLVITATTIIQGAAAWGKTVTGWVEDAYIYPEAFVVRTKIDTGAQHSSLHATKVSFYEHYGTRWLRFWLVNRHGETILIKKPVTRIARIKRHYGEIQERPVIRLELCLAGITKTVEVNVVDRSGFDYPLLIGRSFLEDDFIVDPATTDKSNTDCQRR